MSFFTRRRLLTLALAAPLCEGAFWLYDVWNSPSYKALGWSPDGSAVVCDYGHADGFDGAVVIVPKNGGREILLHENPGGSQACYSASFSPDGKKVEFAHFGLYIIDSDGKNERKIEKGAFLGWSPSSPWMVMEENGKKWEIHASTGERRAFRKTIVVNSPQTYEKFSPQKLPNGDFVIPGWNTNDQLGIWRVNPKGDGKLLIRGYYPLVSPQGDTLAYTDNGKLRFLALD